MILEQEFKNGLIERLSRINSGWIDGDKEEGEIKKADIVNHQLKIAVEIKDDTKYKIEIPRSSVMVGGGQDLTLMNQRFEDRIRSANRKFDEYNGYKTILLFRTEFWVPEIIRYAIEGLHTYRYSSVMDNLIYSGRVSKYSEYNRKHIGCFLIFNLGKAYYFPNHFAHEIRVLSKEEVSSVSGLEFKEVEQV
ncbi:hypothetical protein A3H56_03240 [Candidatus Nomurabacteria bacterium RIFCSPLOWO2_02_FULL_42_24]|nr:MAG: hypothetical protein A3H56_03240 [Candidatus Nomurabacteria bacterium RIFCSPLOWO2_02_FULL_42_24]